MSEVTESEKDSWTNNQNKFFETMIKQQELITKAITNLAERTWEMDKRNIQDRESFILQQQRQQEAIEELRKRLDEADGRKVSG